MDGHSEGGPRPGLMAVGWHGATGKGGYLHQPATAVCVQTARQRDGVLTQTETKRRRREAAAPRAYSGSCGRRGSYSTRRTTRSFWFFSSSCLSFLRLSLSACCGSGLVCCFLSDKKVPTRDGFVREGGMSSIIIIIIIIVVCLCCWGGFNS